MKRIGELKEKHKRMPRFVIKQRKKLLNRSLFPSEKWFSRLLDTMQIRGYSRNRCIADRFFGDFVFRRIKTVIEIDGKSHDGKEDYDKTRDELITFYGYKVIRIKHNDTAAALKAIEQIKDAQLKKRIFRKNKNKEKALRYDTKERENFKSLIKRASQENLSGAWLASRLITHDGSAEK